MAWNSLGRHEISRYPEAFQALGGWLREGRLMQKEDVILGLENASRTLIGLLTGESFGKRVFEDRRHIIPIG